MTGLGIFNPTLDPSPFGEEGDIHLCYGFSTTLAAVRFALIIPSDFLANTYLLHQGASNTITNTYLLRQGATKPIAKTDVTPLPEGGGAGGGVETSEP